MVGPRPWATPWGPRPGHFTGLLCLCLQAELQCQDASDLGLPLGTLSNPPFPPMAISSLFSLSLFIYLVGEHLHLPQPLHSPRIRIVRVWSAPRRLGASLVKRQSDLGPPIYLVSQIQWVGRAGQRVSQAWLEGSREGDIQEPQCDAVGRTRPQMSSPTPPPATGRWTWRPPGGYFTLGSPPEGSPQAGQV